MKQSQKTCKKIVIKIGSSLLSSAKSGTATHLIDSIAEQIARLLKQGREAVIVSSGAISCGMGILGIENRPKDLARLQAAAAIGQNELMDLYRDAFKKRSINCAQVLLTWEDFSGRKRYLNAKNTLNTLLKLGSVPVVNENDTVSTEEIKFGDNDRLSALVAGLIKADLLLILSDVDGLLDKENNLIRAVCSINAEVKSLASPTDKKTCVGGMITKLEAAKISIDSGIPCVIANGRAKDVVISVADDPDSCGTLFAPRKSYLCGRKHWIAFGTRPKASVSVDEGAKRALLNNKSLLTVGVKAAKGNFDCGDIISVTDTHGAEFARGRAGISDLQLEKTYGKRSDRELIHRDNIVIL